MTIQISMTRSRPDGTSQIDQVVGTSDESAGRLVGLARPLDSRADRIRLLGFGLAKAIEDEAKICGTYPHTTAETDHLCRRALDAVEEAVMLAVKARYASKG